MLWLILFSLIFLFWVTPRYLRYHRKKRLLQRFPIIDLGFWASLYVLYHLLSWKQTKDMTNFLEKLGKMHSKHDCFVIWFFHLTFIVVKKPEYVEVILSREISKSKFYDCLQPYLGKGLLTSNGTSWKNHRKLLAQAFNFRILEEFIPIMNNQANILIEVLRERSRCEPWLDIYPIIGRCALDIICETSMGIHLGSQRGNHPEYAHSLNKFQSLGISKILNPLNNADFIYYRTVDGKQYLKHTSTLLSFTKQAFYRRKKGVMQYPCKLCQTNDCNNDDGAIASKSSKLVPLMDLLLHFHLHEKKFSEQQVQDEVNTFMAGGYETTALTMTWTLYLLGLHPEIQEKVLEELLSIFGSDKERDATKDDIRQMKYLECVIKESLRVRSTVPLIVRSVNENISIDKDLVIPQGTECVIPFSLIHHDKNLFAEPERFIPERFLPEQMQRLHAFSYIPFSAGPRICIGQRYAMNEMKIVLSAVLRYFSVISLDSQDKIRVDKNVTYKPKCPIRIIFTLR